MYRYAIDVKHEFHPVGQGLFSTCTIVLNYFNQPERNKTFYSVFDCGTASQRSYLNLEVQSFKNIVGASTVGLFCLSHFDDDHVNGATELLQTLHVEVLALPYFSLAERMLLAARQNASGTYLQFLAEPVRYISAVSINKNIRVVFINGDDQTAMPQVVGGNRPIHDPENDDHEMLILTIPDGEDAEDVDPSLSMPGRSSLDVTVISHKEPFVLGFFWEFFFYNERRETEKIEALRQDVDNAVRLNKNTDGSYDSNNLINQLLAIYGRILGRTATAKNSISLVMYTGWANYDWATQMRSFTDAYVALSGVLELTRHIEIRSSYGLPNTGVLYTGDVCFNTPIKLNAAVNHYGAERWSKILLLQVPHHGSSHSWFQGGSILCSHEISVFTAGSGRTKHPSRSVLVDLAGRNPYIIHEHQRLKLLSRISCW